MAIGRPTKPLNVTPQEKEKLLMLARRPKSAQAMAMRARIVLGCNDGLSNGEVAKRLRITELRSANGGSDFGSSAWRVYLMNRAWAHRGR